MSNEILIKDGVKYELWAPPDEEKDFEPMIKEHVKDIFGEDCEYFPKQKLKTLADNRSIPDGFVVDFKNRKWYVLENKLLCDDAIKRISGQIVDYKNAIKNRETRREIYKSIKSIKNTEFLDDLINEDNPEIIVIINSLDGKLGEQFQEKVTGVDKNAKIVEFKTFARDGVEPKIVHVHLFKPLYEEKQVTELKLRRITDFTENQKIEETKKDREKIISDSVVERKDSMSPKRARKGEVTSQDLYIIPILESLIEMGGSGRPNDVLVKVGQKMEDKLKPKDYETLPSGVDTRWENSAMWARNTMANKLGLLKPKEESGRGVWEISDKGRKHYKENKSN